MALTAGREENEPPIQKKPRRSCGGCCPSCCFCCIQCLSGSIFLLTIAGLVLCARIFLEFPSIINGFGKSNNSTVQAVSVSSEILGNTACSYGTCIETCQMFVGSFQLLNETYQTEYKDTSSVGFQSVATRIHTMINMTFKNSMFNETYRHSSLFALRPSPFSAHVQLLFCNGSTTSEMRIQALAVENVLKSWNGSLGKADISVDTQSVAVGGEAPCPTMDLEHAWPWQAVLQEKRTNVCTCTLLTGLWVLSSAGCVNNRDPSLLTVILQNRTWNVEKVIPHPNFTAAPTVNNIALILLSKPVWFNSSIMPICLPPTLQDPAVGSLCNTTVKNISGANSTESLIEVSGTVTTGPACSSEPKYGIIYVIPSLSNTPLSQMGEGNILACMNKNRLVYLQGISPYLQIISQDSPCLTFPSIGPSVEWIKSYILS